MFAYCQNNPITYYDPSGTLLHSNQRVYINDGSRGRYEDWVDAIYLPSGGTIEGGGNFSEDIGNNGEQLIHTQGMIFVSPNDVKKIVENDLNSISFDEEDAFHDLYWNVAGEAADLIPGGDCFLVSWVIRQEEIANIYNHTVDETKFSTTVQNAYNNNNGIVVMKVYDYFGGQLRTVAFEWSGKFGNYPYARIPYDFR